MKASKASSKKGSSKRAPSQALAKPDGPSSVENPFWEPLALAATATSSSESLNRAMEVIATIFRADRAWIGRYNPTLTHFWGVSDWVAPGIASHLQEIQGVSVDVLGAAHQIFL